MDGLPEALSRNDFPWPPAGRPGAGTATSVTLPRPGVGAGADAD